MRTQQTAITILIIFAVTATLFFTLGWIIRDPPKDTTQINIGLTPLDLYPLNIDGWTFTVHIDGHYSTSTGTKSDLWTAEKGSTHLESTSWSDLIRQIQQIEGTK